eukprot:EG_transcript_43389
MHPLTPSIAVLAAIHCFGCRHAWPVFRCAFVAQNGHFGAGQSMCLDAGSPISLLAPKATHSINDPSIWPQSSRRLLPSNCTLPRQRPPHRYMQNGVYRSCVPGRLRAAVHCCLVILFPKGVDPWAPPLTFSIT